MRSYEFPELREGVRQVVSQFDSRYWQEVDEARAFPEKFVTALTEAGWLSGLIPEAYGGSGLSLTEASVVMEEINRAGGNSGACHGQMYVMGCVVRHGSEQQKRDLLPRIASGQIRMQSMAVTEPTTGSDTWRRNPDLKWRIAPADLSRLVAEQRALLRTAAALVKPGGVLVYGTCSLFAEENEQQLGWFEQTFPGFRREPADAILSAQGVTDAAQLSHDGLLSTRPDRDGTDGFFGVRWRAPE